MAGRVSYWEGLKYRGGVSMWAWVLHRLTGLGVLLFLLVHIWETFMLSMGPEFYDRTIQLYNSAVFRVAEVALLFCVLYHAINGLRITVQDLFPGLWRFERAFIWASGVIFLLIYVPLVILALLPVFRGEL